MARNRSRRWRRAMMAALVEACDNGPGRLHKKNIPLIWGMRAVRDFERINGVKFDPLDSAHRMHTFHMGRARLYLAYFRDFRRVLTARERPSRRAKAAGAVGETEPAADPESG